MCTGSTLEICLPHKGGWFDVQRRYIFLMLYGNFVFLATLLTFAQGYRAAVFEGFLSCSAQASRLDLLSSDGSAREAAMAQGAVGMGQYPLIVVYNTR